MATVPGAPTNVSAVAGNASATVSWSAPASNGGAAITSYTVTSSTGQMVTVSNVLTATVTGLTPGAPVTFTVKATNVHGDSASSPASFTGRAVPYNPTQIPGLQMWLDGSDPNGTGAQPSAGTAVNTWADKSGNGRNGIASNSPVFATGGGILFNGINQAYNTTYTSTPSVETVFVVFKINSNSGIQVPIGHNGVTGNRSVDFNANGSTSLTRYFTSNIANGATNILTNKQYMYNYTYSSGGNTKLYLNGTEDGAATNSAAFSGAGGFTVIGYYPYANSYIGGIIHEVIIYNTVLTTQQRQNVEGYLAWKWGLGTSLQNTHPYYSIGLTREGPVVLLQAKNYSGSGSWIDESGYGRNATLAAGISAKNAEGNGIVLNGSTFWTFPNVGVGNAWTVNVWFKRTGNLTGTGACIVTQQYTAGNPNINIVVGDIQAANNNAIQSGFYRDEYGGYWTSTNWSSTSTPLLPLNTWINIQATWNGSTLVEYINGSSFTTLISSHVAVDGGLPYNIGRRWDNTSYMVGEIGEVRMYNYALSATQVLDDYNTSLFMFQQHIAPIPGPVVLLQAKNYSGSGAWLDESGYGRNATLAAGTISKNTTGNGIVLDGSSCWTFPNVGAGNAWTANVWFKRTAASTAAYAFILGQAYTGGDMNIAIGDIAQVNNGSASGGFWNATNLTYWSYGTPYVLPLNTWVNMQVTWDGANIRTYINGSINSTVPYTTTALDGNLSYFIGSSWDQLKFYVGEIGEVRMYNYALNATQVLQDYNTSLFMFQQPIAIRGGPVVLLQAKNYSGSGSWLDESGYGRNATLAAGTISKNTTGNGIVLNGSSYWTFPNVGVGNAWTANVWFKRTGNQTAGSASILAQQFPGTLSRINVTIGDIVNANNNTVSGGYWNGGWVNGTACALPLNTWVNIQICWNGASLLTYINGAFISSLVSSVVSETNDTPYNIGKRWGSADYMVGEIGEVRMYNYALSATQVLDDYNTSLFMFQQPIAPFKPTQIPGLQMWLDGADPLATGTAPAASSVVNTWSDKSGNGRNGTGVAGPTFVAGGGIALNGSSQYYTTTYSANPTTETAFIVGNSTGNIGANQIVIGTSAVQPGSRELYLYKGAHFYLNRQNVGSIGGATNAQNSTFLYNYVYNSLSASFYLNGTSQGANSFTAAFTSGSVTNIGSSGAVAGSPFAGTMYEIIIYNTALTGQQLQDVEGYLAWKWGLKPILPNIHPYYSIAPIPLYPTSSFNPKQIPGVQMWLDGSDPNGTGAQPSAGTAITTWADKSGNGYNGTGVAGPTFVAGGGIALNGTSQYYTTNYTGVPTAETAFIVINFNSGNYNKDILGSINSSTYGGRQYDIYQGKIITNNYNIAGYAGGATTIPINTTLLLDYTFTSGTMKFYYNGTQDGTTTGISYSGSGKTSIGTSYGTTVSPGNFLNATIHEVIIYNTVLTLQQRQDVEGYLALKWGLRTSLQNTHPYYSIQYVPLYPITYFSPSEIPGVQMWLDGSDPNGTGIQPSAGTAITTWADKSGNGRNGTGIAGPTFVSGGGIAFNGTSQYFTTTYTAAASTESIFVVYKTNSLESLGTLVDSSASGGRQFGLYSASAGPSLANNSVAWVLLGSYPNTTGTTYIAECTYSTSGVNLYVTGNASANNTTNPGFTAGTTTIGAGYYTNGMTWFLNGTISEVIIYNTVLTTQQRQSVEGYLAWKWGLKPTLQDSHPYYSNSITAFTVPGAPTLISAIGGDASATVSWNAPASNGGSEITGYIVISSVGNSITVGNVTTATITGLYVGMSQTFTVKAINAAGSSAASSESQAIVICAVPREPMYVSAVPSNASATVSWFTPSNDGGSAITGYIVTPSVGSPVTVGNVLTAIVSNLTNGTAVTFTVKAINALGNSVASAASGPVTPYTVPGVPTNVSAVPGFYSITVSWTAPSNGGSAITRYDVTSSAGDTVEVYDGLTTTFAFYFVGSFRFTVTAINEAGSSLPSAQSSLVTPFTAPGAPTGVSAVSGNGSAIVSWTAPASNGGSPITGYRVTSSFGNTVTVGNVTTATLTGLTNGLPVAFEVISITAVAESAGSFPSPYVTPSTLADAPTNVIAEARNGGATVSWMFPNSNGGSEITGFTVTASTGQTITVSGYDSYGDFTNLTNGTAVTFTVKATNIRGDSVASAASAPITPVGFPDAPTNVSAVAGTNSAIVSWSAPASNGGSAITGYTVTPSVGQPVTVGNVLSTTLSGLVGGTALTFKVVTITSYGTSADSSPSASVTPISVADAPTNVSAVAGNESATVSWTAPASNGGSAITGYRVTPSLGSPVTVGNVTTASFTGLTNGTPITFTVLAINSVGNSLNSLASSSVTPATLPGVPTGLSAVAGNKSVTVTWIAPASNGGLAITGYTLTPSIGSPVTVGNVLTATVSNLTNGTPVSFTVKAINALGSSSVSSSVTATPIGSLPLAPTGVSAVAGNASVTVSWIAPASDVDSPITGYLVTPSLGSPVTVGNVTTASFTGLTNGIELTFTVKTINSAGSSSASSSPAVTPATLPGAPTSVTAVGGNASATVSWNAPASDGGLAITGYTVTPSVGSPVTVRNVRIATLTNLTNGTPVTFTVVAINSLGSSSASSSSAVTPTAALPGSPTGISAVVGNSSTTVSWNPPVVSGDSPITGYIITPSSGSPITVGNVLTADLPTVSSDGTPITYTVVAINSSGSSSASLPRPAVIPATAPGAPTGVSVVAGNASATVSWNAPASDGGSAITGYIITPSVGSPITVGDVRIVTFNDLSNGTPITFTVKAINSVGSSSDPLVQPPAVTPVATLPGAPASISVVPGVNSATVSWTAPAVTGSSPITGYIITPSVGEPFTVGSDVLTASFPGLTNGTPVTFTVTAINSSGSSSATLAPSAITPATLPGEPTGVSVVAGNASATVSWNAPASDGGSEITGYIITPSVGSPITVGDVRIVTFNGLSNGTPITFTVKAINAVGSSSEPLAQSPAVTPVAILPSAPTDISVVPGVNSATVSWTAPAVTGGSPITGYIITPSVGPPFTVGSDVLTASFPVLSDGTPVTFTVTAINSSGSSSASLAPPAITPPSEASVPGSPTGVSAVAANASATVSWTAPASNGGAEVVGYTVTPSVGSPVTVGNVLNATLSGLTNGTAVTFTVKAINSVGSSSASSASSEVTPATVPDAPTAVSAVASNASATVSWTAPASNGGSVITGYTVTPSVGSPLTVGNVTTATLSDLTNGTALTFTVKAINAVGNSSDSSASSAVTPATLPGAPTGVSAVAGNASATVSWTAPESNGGSVITGYTVTPSVGMPITVGNVTNATLSGLTNGTALTFTVKAINAIGNSSVSSSSSAITPAAVPGAPTGVSAVAGDASATVYWNAPASNGGSAITGYTVTPSVGSPVTVGNVLTATISNLTNGTAVTFTVKAINSAGSSATSSSSAITPATVPDAPTGVSAVAGNASAIVSWTAPASNGGSPITGYTITPYLGSPVRVGNVLTATVFELINGTPITFTVKATNSVGNSSGSSSSAVTPATVPGAPTGVTVVAGTNSATVSWVAPFSNGGSPITGYTVTPSVGSPVTVENVTTATLTGFATGTLLTFTVVAINAVGGSPNTPVSQSVRPLGVETVPGAPRGITVVAGTNSATVSWSEPYSNGGSPITGYTITPSVGEAVTVGNVTTATLTGLTSGIPITFTVVALNALGGSPNPPVSQSVTPTSPTEGPPSSVLDVTGVAGLAGVASATIRWTPPVSDGGSPVTGYKVICVPDNKKPNIAGPTATSLVIPGIKNGITTTFTVVALNAAGQSDTVIFTPYPLPGAPKVTAVRGASGVINLSWTAKPSNPASPITGYIVSLVSPSAQQSMLIPTPLVTPTGGSVSVSGLTYGSNCVFSVRSVSGIGQSAASLSKAVMAAGLPDAPASFAGTRGVANAQLTWVAPTNTGGLPIIGYTISYIFAGAVKTVKLKTVTSAIVKGLVNGTEYSFTIQAITLFGSSLPTSPVVVTPGTGL